MRADLGMHTRPRNGPENHFKFIKTENDHEKPVEQGPIIFYVTCEYLRLTWEPNITHHIIKRSRHRWLFSGFFAIAKHRLFAISHHYRLTI